MWIEIGTIREVVGYCLQSRPARALWIEILFSPDNIMSNHVEAREGLVD